MLSWILSALQIFSGILCIQANSKASSLGGQQVLDCRLQYPDGKPVTYMVEWKKDGLEDSVFVMYDGYPPNINPLFKDRVRLVDGISLEISHIKEQDEGWYECKVVYIDGVGNGDNKSNGTWIYLNVNIPPKIISSSDPSFHQPLNSTVQINCRAAGSPKPKVTWTKDDKIIRQTSRVKLINSGSDVLLAEVLISNLQESDGGIYKCTFQNAVGLISQTVHLIVEGKAYIIVPPSNKTAVLGQRIQFTCEARGYPTNITYSWYKDNTNVNTFPLYGERIIINSRDGSLVITDIQKDDMGWYQCRPSNGVGEDNLEAVAYLNVTYEPEVMVSLMPRSAIWAMGFKEKLDCPVKANPPAHSIVWTKNGVVIATTSSRLVILGNGTLVVSQVAMTDAGNYRCTAISSFGTGESEIVQVEVKDPPRFTLRPESQYILSLGETVRMSCAATGTPRPSISWRKKDSGTLTFDGRIQIQDGNLTIFNLQKSDHGVYECEASNEVRKIVVSTMLTVQNTTPHAPYNISVATKWFSATVSWMPAFSSSPQNFLIWYRSVVNNMPSKWETMRVVPQNTTKFTLYKLKSDTLYEFKVSSRNILGGGDDSSSSAIVQARTLAKERSTEKSSGYEIGIPDVPPTDETGSTYFPPIYGTMGPRPTTPANLSVKLNGEKIQVSWDAPEKSPVTIYHYLVEYNIGSGWKKADLIKAPLTTFLFDSVENGQTHSFRVSSRGIYAFSLPSEMVSLQAPEEDGFGLSSTEIGGIIGGLLFLIVAVLLAVIAVMCSRRRDRRKNTKYGNVKYLGPQEEADGRPQYPPEWSDVSQSGRRGDTMTSNHSNKFIGHDNGIFMVPKSGNVLDGFDKMAYHSRDNLVYIPDRAVRNMPYSDRTYNNSGYPDTTYHSDRHRSLTRSQKSVPYDDDDNGFRDNTRLRNRSRSQPPSQHFDGPKYPVPERPRSRGLSLPRDVRRESERYPPQPQVPVSRQADPIQYFTPVMSDQSFERSRPNYPIDDDDEEVFMPPPITSIIPDRPSLPRHSSMKPGAQQTYLTEDFNDSRQPFITSDISSVLPSPFSDSTLRRPYYPYQRQYADVSGNTVPYGSHSRLPDYSQNGSYGNMDNTVVARQPSPNRTMSRTLSNGEDSSDSSGRPMNYTRDQLLGAVDLVRKGPKSIRRGQQFGSQNVASDGPHLSRHGAQIPESVKPSVVVRDRPSRAYLNDNENTRYSGSINSSGSNLSRPRGSHGSGNDSRPFGREDLTPDSISSGIGSRNTSSQLTGSSLHSRPSRLGSNLTHMEHDISEDSAVPFLDCPPPHRKDVSGDENYEFDSYNAVESDLLEALKNYTEVNNGNEDLFSALQEGLNTTGLMSELYPKPRRQSRYSDSEERFEKLRGEFQKYRQEQRERSRSDQSQGSSQGQESYPRLGDSYSSTRSSTRHSGNYGYPDRGSQYYGGQGDGYSYKAGPMDSDML